MMLFFGQRFKKFLRGEFICRVCGKTVFSYTFGYGEVVCPSCFTIDDLDNWFFPDMSYILNRLFHRQRSPKAL